MTVIRLCSLIGICSILIYFSCATPKNTAITLPSEGDYFDYISDYGIFEIKNGEFIPNEQLVKYEVTNALFSDYAKKDRYVFMPEGKSASLKVDGFFDWPEGSMIVKNFGYSKTQLGNNRVMETRLLIKDLDSWKAISYIWDKAQKVAKISKVGDVFPLKIQHATEELSFDYVVPNKNQCKSCHNKNEKIDPLGFKYANLDREIQTATGSVNQLEFLMSKNIISGLSNGIGINSMVAYSDGSADLQDRALAYLDVNCGHCHRPEGPGNTSGLFLQYNEKRTNHLGYCKGPVAAGKGSGGRDYDIAPGEADKSILVYRMASKDPGVMMPEIGRSLAHAEGIKLIEEWINNIEYDCSTQNSEL